MAGLDRLAIRQALAARVASVARLTGGVLRRLPPSGQVGPGEQPCAFLPLVKEAAQHAANQPAVWTMPLTLIVYARTDDAALMPDELLGPIVQDIETALQWKAGVDVAHGVGQQLTATNLGGACAYACVTDVEYGEGAADGQGVAFISITVVAEVK